MKIILDTNILIHIEDQKELVPNLQELLQIFRKYGHLIFIHPASFRDIDNDQNIPRRKIISSKLKGYPIIESPPKLSNEFISSVGSSSSPNDVIDNNILSGLSGLDSLYSIDGFVRSRIHLDVSFFGGHYPQALSKVVAENREVPF